MIVILKKVPSLFPRFGGAGVSSSYKNDKVCMDLSLLKPGPDPTQCPRLAEDSESGIQNLDLT